MAANPKLPGVASALPLLESVDALSYLEPETQPRLLTFSNGDFYEGETLAELRHGKGKHTCSNGDTHDGNWYKGMRHGKGLAIFARGFEYEGEFQYDHAQGSGRAKYENGSVYDGEFKRDQRCGWGVQCFPDESVYVGEWKNDQMTGKGRLTFRDGSFFEGSWREGKRVQGKWVSADGKQEYVGSWQGENRHGVGTFIIEGLQQYTGEWEDDLQHGKGKCRWVDGSAYDGSWTRGTRNGHGVIARADGYKYDGTWKDDKEHGTGNARLANGDRYTGDFQDGLPHGNGRMHSKEGERYEGEFMNGKKHGKGRCSFPNGDKYQGEWVEGKRHGSGLGQFADGTLFDGEWQGDQWLQTEAEPSLSKVVGEGLARAVAGQDTSFAILAKDELRNKRLAGGDNFLVWLEGPITVHATVHDNNDGTYSAVYNTEVAGMYDLYITNDTGESVAESPYPLRVVANKPEPQKSTIRLKSSTLKVEESVDFKVEARDRFGNRCKTADLPADLPIECEMALGSIACGVHIQATAQGCYACMCKPSTPGYYRLTVLSNGKYLSNCPVSIKIESSTGPAAEEGHRLVDQSQEWERKAASQFAEDGDAQGWDSDSSDTETAEQRYIREHPEVPVVENLEDMWRLTALQRERKAKKEKEQALQELQQLKNARLGNKAVDHAEENGAVTNITKLTNKMRHNSIESRLLKPTKDD